VRQETSPLPAWAATRLGNRSPGAGAARVIRALDANPRLASYASTADVARLADVNVGTVVRAAQLLGFTGWPALRLELRSRYLASLSTNEILSEHLAQAETTAKEAVRRDLANLQELSRSLDPAHVSAIANLVRTSGRTVVLGSGSFAAPGLQLAHLAQTMGYDVRLHREGGTALLNTAALLGPQDCLVIFSLWRSPSQLLAAVRVAHEQGCQVVSVSDRRVAELAEIAAEMVVVPSEGASFFPSLGAAMTLVHAVLAEMVNQDEARARAAAGRAEALWERYGLFTDLPVDGAVGDT
jgi:DNA-binding MurR/RpiR family transcriptional regulator